MFQFRRLFLYPTRPRDCSRMCSMWRFRQVSIVRRKRPKHTPTNNGIARERAAMPVLKPMSHVPAA